MNKILILQGPNLNMLGAREKGIYGVKSLTDLHLDLAEYAKKVDLETVFFQSNSEAELIDKIHSCTSEKVEFILMNPAAFTHTSIALRDALLSVNLPFLEIHISNIYTREEFRHKSFFSDIALGVIAGLGTYGYKLGLDAAKNFFVENSN